MEDEQGEFVAFGSPHEPMSIVPLLDTDEGTYGGTGGCRCHYFRESQGGNRTQEGEGEDQESFHLGRGSQAKGVTCNAE